MKGKFVLDPLMGLNMYLEKMLKSLTTHFFDRVFNETHKVRK